MKLLKESDELTTFLTPFGSYSYRRLPFDTASVPEVFQRQTARVLEGRRGVVNMVNDILVHGKNRHEHDQRLTEVLKCLERAGAKLNKKKTRISYHFCQVPEIDR